MNLDMVLDPLSLDSDYTVDGLRPKRVAQAALQNRFHFFGDRYEPK